MLITELGAVVSERTGDTPVVEKDGSRLRRRGSIIGARHVGPIQDTAADYEAGRPGACFRTVANAQRTRRA
jgi:hypothetical protein